MQHVHHYTYDGTKTNIKLLSSTDLHTINSSESSRSSADADALGGCASVCIMALSFSFAT